MLPGVEDGGGLSEASPITNGLQEVLTIFTGAVNAKSDSELTHTPILLTGTLSGTMSWARRSADSNGSIEHRSRDPQRDAVRSRCHDDRRRLRNRIRLIPMMATRQMTPPPNEGDGAG